MLSAKDIRPPLTAKYDILFMGNLGINRSIRVINRTKKIWDEAHKLNDKPREESIYKLGQDIIREEQDKITIEEHIAFLHNLYLPRR